MDLYGYDKTVKSSCFCGIDEAGRGPLAGPVVAAAVILSLEDKNRIDGLNDSKKLTPKKREEAYEKIIEKAVDYSIGVATVEEIERENILKATFLAMKRAVEGLKTRPNFCLVDGNRNPVLDISTRCIVNGDAISASIAAASIVAKVRRDRMMVELDEKYPGYDFFKHKGYGTKLHYEKIIKNGITDIHRKSFLRNLKEKKKTISNINGQLGEKLAYGYLIRNKYKILDRNYKSEHGEIDIIAKKDNCLVFVEVKLRDVNCGYAPKEAVTKSKQRKIVKTALCYIMEHPNDMQPRFDVIEIQKKSEDEVNINLIKNAYEPEEEYGFI